MTRVRATARAFVAGAVLTGWIAAAGAQDTVENPPPAERPAATEAAPAQREVTTAPKEMTPPRIVSANVDWNGVRAALSAIPLAQNSDAGSNSDLLARLNAATDTTYRGITRSTVPVLMPVDTGAILNTTAATLPPPAGDAASFKLHFFSAGPAGYDAAFTLQGAVTNEVTRFEKKEDPLVLMSGFALLYDLPPATGEAEKPAKELDPLFPGIRRRLLESYVRYTFEKFGVSYTASMLCFDGRAHARWVTCREADKILAKFVKSLQLAGGTPQQVAAQAPNTIDRPKEESPEFTFATPGKLIAKTGFNGFDGRNDWTVYAKIRFPLAAPPAFANSQSFMNWGNCDFTGKTSRREKKGTQYRCKINDKPLVFDESAPENRSYPWRDNFCEHRRFMVGQCPGGEGHQGQDIRPANCKLFNDGADRCLPFMDEVVAVRDGVIMRVPKREALYLLVNAPGEHLRFRYLHMHPGMLDDAGFVSGRQVIEGELIGKASNFDRVANGTSYHVHFEIQVPTRDGWVFVNPYATLIGAYERLIGGRGREFIDPVAATPPPPTPPAAPTPPASAPEVTAPAPATAPVAKVETPAAKPPAPAATPVAKITPSPATKRASRSTRAASRASDKALDKAIAEAKKATPIIAREVHEKPTRRARTAKVRTRAARTAERATVRPPDADVPIPTHGIKSRDSSREAKGELPVHAKARRTEAACKAAAAGRRGNRTCQPSAAKYFVGANGV